jgi:arylsulfatase A-like enzyme
MNAASNGRATKTRPNIVLIVMDATRAQNLSCYGYQRPTTPHLERFAERAVVYEQAISTSCWSLPCHASIFTGLYPARHGADDQHQFLDRHIPTLPELLRNYGYRTLAFCTKRDIGPETGMDRGFAQFNPDHLPASARRIARRVENGIARMLGQRDAGLRAHLRQIGSLLPRLKANGQPFFMFLSTVESHIPYNPPKKYWQFLPKGVSAKQIQELNQDRWKYMIGRAPMCERDFELLCALYDGGVAYADAGIARFLAWLEQLGMLDRTMVIIMGDHGENLGEHHLMAHGYCLYDTVVGVPLIIHYPQGTSAPGQVKYQVQPVDILPTILTMLSDTSSEVFRALQGYDLLSSSRHDFSVAEQAAPDLTPFYKRFPGADVSMYDRSLKMIRTDQYKYIWSSDGRHELYDLTADPKEIRNIVAERPDIADEQDQRLTEWYQRHGQPLAVAA